MLYGSVLVKKNIEVAREHMKAMQKAADYRYLAQ